MGGRGRGSLSLTRQYRTLLWEMDHTGGDQRVSPFPPHSRHDSWTRINYEASRRKEASVRKRIAEPAQNECWKFLTSSRSWTSTRQSDEAHAKLKTPPSLERRTMSKTIID
ncbi:hypothetical protein NPIL_429201 [Nephila pilipes]|uniref:Uncharacterized protein n=1 Tax=Nephila pilipes TaxID=299642 RepID=A0A8X6QAB2_NEPPI|nr:hypothetical protein NPIL_429201 [Nephila pilipes]